MFGDSTLLLAGFFYLLTAGGQDANEEPRGVARRTTLEPTALTTRPRPAPAI